MKKLTPFLLLFTISCGGGGGGISSKYEPMIPISINELNGIEEEIIQEMNEYFEYELFYIDNENPDFELVWGVLDLPTLGQINYTKKIIIMSEKLIEKDPIFYRYILYHELGHSIGAEHSQNPQSIMYPDVPITQIEDSFSIDLDGIVDDLILGL